jgi:Protein of unknown function (DUF3037)
MDTACHYALVRFLPFVETGEFAVVGVVLFAPKANYFGYKLLTLEQHDRVTRFFQAFDAKHFQGLMHSARNELQRVADQFKAHSFESGRATLDDTAVFALWNELTKPLGSMLRMDEPRLAMATDPAAKLEELFQFYVERNFVTREYQEEALFNRGVKI